MLKGGRNSLRISFGIQGGKRFSTATFRAGALFYPYPGSKPRAESCSPFGTKSVFSEQNLLNTCPHFRCHITQGIEDDDEDENEAPGEGGS